MKHPASPHFSGLVPSQRQDESQTSSQENFGDIRKIINHESNIEKRPAEDWIDLASSGRNHDGVKKETSAHHPTSGIRKDVTGLGSIRPEENKEFHSLPRQRSLHQPDLRGIHVAPFTKNSFLPRRIRKDLKSNISLSNQEEIIHNPPEPVDTVGESSINHVSYSEPCGFFRLSPVDNEELIVGPWLFDIVAVHGITGTAIKTWTHKNGYLWLRDHLPKAMPGVRVYSFGYDARVLFSRGAGDLDSFARSLLVDLMNVRRSEEEQRRKIMFVCHSMGGIVVKRALHLAREDNNHKNVPESLSAILFLATPHCGSKEAHVGWVIGKMIKLGISLTPRMLRFGVLRLDLVEALRPGSRLLEEITRTFTDQELMIASFIEQDISWPTMTRVVDEHNGLLGSLGTVKFPNERYIPMPDCNHRNICRFGGEDSQRLKSVMSLITEFARATNASMNAGNNALDLACLKSLSFPSINNRVHNLTPSHPQTCDWLNRHPAYEAFLSKRTSILWLKGKPGTGKTTLLSHLHTIQHAIPPSSPSPPLILSFFFHGRGTALQKSSLGMYRTLLHQLYANCPAIRGPIRAAFAEKQAFGEQDVVWEWGVKELQEMVSEAIKTMIRWTPAVLFIDALDEAGVGLGPKVVDWLARLLDWATGENKEFRTVVSCRHYPVLSLIPGEVIVVEHENAADLRRFVVESLEKGIKVWTRDESGCTELRKLEGAICGRAAGIFQWASLATRMVIEEINDGQSAREVHDMLHQVPKGLNGLYQHILADVIKAKHRSKALLIMQWVCLAETPLSLVELRHALASDDEYLDDLHSRCEHSKGFVEQDGRMAVLIHSHSGGLIEVQARPEMDAPVVQFIHQSVADYFRASGLAYLTSRTQPEHADTSLDVGTAFNDQIIAQSHDRLAKACINYLTFSSFVKRVKNKRKYAGWDFFSEHVISDFPLAQYASNYWFVHAEKSERLGVKQEMVLQKFDSHPNAYQSWLVTYDTLGTNQASPALGRYCPAEGGTPLQVAAFANLMTTVQYLLRQGVDVEEKAETAPLWDARAVHFAATKGNTQVLDLLSYHGAQLSPQTNNGYTPCQIAAMRDHHETVNFLQSKGVDIHEVTRYGTTLMAACRSGRTSLVQMLLDAGADVNKTTPNGKSALQEAAFGGSLEIVKRLLQYGARIAQTGGYYGSAIQAAIQRDRFEVVRFLLDQGASPMSDGVGGSDGNACQIAARNGNLRILEALVARGADINTASEKYSSALHAAVANPGPGAIETVTYLLRRGADPSARGGTHGNALQEASHGGQEAFVRLLLELGAQVNVEGGYYGFALQAAAHRNHRTVVSMLLAEGADINKVGGAYGSALQAACEGASPQLVHDLIAHGADVNLRGGRYGCALSAAAACCRPELVQHLLSVGADPDCGVGDDEAECAYGYPLLAALLRGFPVSMSYVDHDDDKAIDVIRILLEHGVELDSAHEQYGTPLHQAAYKGDVEIFQLLLHHGAKVSLQAGQHRDILQSAAAGRQRKHYGDTLLAIPVNVSRASGELKTAPNAAVVDRDKRLVEMLLRHGAEDVEFPGGRCAPFVARTDLTRVTPESTSRSRCS